MSVPRKSTVALVAQRAGVSVASVSRVLNNLPASESIAAKVRKAAEELGYVPDAMARSLKVGRTEQIALAVADVGNPVYVTMMHAVSEVVREAGFRLVLSSTGNDPNDVVELLDNLERGYADGVILSPLRITDEIIARLTSTRLPVVVIGSLPQGVLLDNVRADSRTGVDIAVARLKATGRKHIAFVNGPVDTVPGSARLTGYLAAMESRGLPTTADMQVEASDFTYAAGLEAAQVLTAQATPDAILCANDLLAVAVMKVITSKGLRVPEDVAIVGMDNTDLADHANPSITSVDLGSAERAREAARLLLARIEDPSRPSETTVVSPWLAERESTADPAPRGHNPKARKPELEEGVS
ncbi:LacI family DNA-binding transcriptional regulator [Arthrobacter tecti]